jgi:serine/threonine protein kinase/tetratricopeptide (TPR) repeat protein
VREVQESSRLIRFESFQVNLRSGELRRAGEKVRLPEQSFQILAMLLDPAGEVVMRQEIQKKLWPNDTVVEFENSINAAVKRLRMALEDSADEPRYIETLARRGYRWMVPVEWVESSAGALQDASPAAVSLPVESTTSNLIGKKVSHYRVLEILGGGGMGVVYKAEDIKLGRRVALKFLPEELSNDAAAKQRLEQEARAASTLNHPNICTIYEVEEEAGQLFIVMELLEGQTLRDMISEHGSDTRKSVPLETFLDLGVQIAEGLDAAHRQGIIHRDIKPANVFMTRRGQVKILDFGLAKVQELDSAEPRSPSPESDYGRQAENLVLTRTGATMGTAGYMSPEQVRGEMVDARTDLFSFGLVLYEMAAGERAFTGETAAILHDAIVQRVPTPVRELNPKIPHELERMICKALEKDRNLRYQSAAEMRADLQRLKRDSGTGFVALPAASTSVARVSEARSMRRKKLLGVLLPAAVVLVIGIAMWLRRTPSVSAQRLTDKDTIVLADFANSTGDAIFDDTLRPALKSSLRQSPFLNILPDGSIASALNLMTRPADTRITPEIAREVCRRQQSTAYIASAIASLGGEYVVGLKAVNCESGEVIAQQQVTAENKDKVLSALGNAATKLREQLGESLTTVGKFDIPLDQTTSSLEALREYNHAMKMGDTDESAQLPYFLRAVQLDPSFAMAYLGTAETYANLNQRGRATEYFAKAFELRDHADARERLEIQSQYFANVTGELEKARETYQRTIESYPKSPAPYGNLSMVYSQQGQYEKAAELAHQVLRVFPSFGGEAYEGIAEDLLPLERYDDARETLQTAVDRKLDTDGVHKDLYAVGFLTGDLHAMAEQAAWLESKPEYASLGFALESDTGAYAGHLDKARVLTRRALDSGVRTDNREGAAMWRDNAALREALFGNRSQARQDAAEALKMAPTSQHIEIEAALALALVGDIHRAETLEQDLHKRFPLDTQVNSVWLPTIDAQLAMVKKQPAAAIDRLQSVAPVELGSVSFSTSVSCLYPVYLRGGAYLAAGSGRAAASEFQKILDHRGIVWNCETGALAHLGLARANALEARTDLGIAAVSARTRALTAYREFFTLWKDADSDIPILKEAKAEYAKLQ